MFCVKYINQGYDLESTSNINKESYFSVKILYAFTFHDRLYYEIMSGQVSNVDIDFS